MKYAKYIDPAHGDTWRELVTPKSIGLILKSIKTEYKFVSLWQPAAKTMIGSR